jgi:hypothetical protein
MDREARSELLSMMGLVAAVVAIVILVFFGLGYLFGRMFLGPLSPPGPRRRLRILGVISQRVAVIRVDSRASRC